jgi:indole-3-glycerol phosphate synthase
LHRLAVELGLAVLVEVHTAEELERALACSPHLVGINHRDLNTFQIDLTASLRLRPSIPGGVFTVAESGIRSRLDVRRLAQAGVDAILVGETLVTAPDVAAKVRELAA